VVVATRGRVLRREVTRLALRDTLQRRATSVAIGVEADINGRVEPDGPVAIDPEQTSAQLVATKQRNSVELFYD
jgi:hypothetical protein